MKILFVSDVSIARVIGGAERVLYEQSTRLAKKGHDVHILTRNLIEHGADHDIIEGVAEWRYRVENNNPFVFLRSTREHGRRLFEKLHQKYSFDCINFHQPFSALGVLRSPENRKIRKIYTCHSLSFEEYRSRNPQPRSILKRLPFLLNVHGRRWIEKTVLSESIKIITLSSFTKEKLRQAYGLKSDQMVVIPGGVDIHRFHPISERKTIRTRLGLPTDRFILLTVRNLVPRMGLENLIDAMRAIVGAIPEICLVIGGGGPLRASLLRQRDDLKLQDNILFPGFIPEADLPDYYRSADVFVLPTVELEGFGLVTLEALASGTPVLGTPIGGTSEILGQLDRHSLFKDTTSESLAELIIEIAGLYREYPDKQHQDSLRCRRFVEENYSWDKNVQATEDLCLDITHKN